MKTKRMEGPDDPAYAFYMRNVKKPRAWVEDLKDLNLYKREGDREAFKRLIEYNQRFVASVAMFYFRKTSGSSIMDLVQAGNIGLIEGIEKYDLKKKIRLITYATWWIRVHVQRACFQHLDLMTPGNNTNRDSWREGRNVLRIDQVNAHRTTRGLVEDPDRNSDELSMFRSEERHSPEYIAREHQVAEIMVELTQLFPASRPMERSIVRRILTEKEDRETLKQIGDRHGVSREHIRQLESKIIGRIAGLLEHRGLLTDREVA